MNIKKSNQEFNKIKKIYIGIMSLYELSDKLFGAIYIAFMRSQNLTITQISNLFSIEQILLAVFDYPTGTISDKIGRKKISAYGFIIWGVGILEFSFAINFCTFLPAMVLMALGLALISGALSAWLIDEMISYNVYGERNQIFPKIQAYIRCFSIIASVVCYFLIDIENRLPIIIAGCISIIAGIITLSVGEDNYGEVKSNSILSIMHDQFKDFIKEKKLVLLSLRTIICYVPFIAFVLFWQIYATEIIGIKTRYLAFFLIMFMIALMVGNYAVSILTKRFGNFFISILGILISIFGFLFLFVFHSFFTFVVAAGLIEIGFGIEQTATSIWMCDYVKSETRAAYSSIFSTIQAVGGFGITNLMGVLTEKININVAWIVAIIVMIFDIFILIIFSNKYNKTIKK